MSDRPILFSGPMVRALLDGRKTQTRRVWKLPTKGIYTRPDMGGWAPTINGGGGSFTIGRDGTKIPVPEKIGIWHQTTGRCLNAPYQIGNRLWVREEWGTTSDLSGVAPSNLPRDARIFYQPRTSYPAHDPFQSRVRASMHMPRWASRLTLTVADVRVQRLQEIIEADAVAEGFPNAWAIPHRDKPGAPLIETNPVRWFSDLWDSLNAKRGFGWEENPWVVAISFSVERRNIDA